MTERKLTRRGTERRGQVLEAAAKLFAEQSYHGTTVSDICDTIGVGKGVFYWYFPSKQAVFMELLQDSLLELRRAQQLAIAEVDDPVRRIEQGIRASIEFFRHNPGFLSMIRIAGRYDEFVGLIELGHQTVVADTATHIKEGMSLGEIRDGDPEMMAHGVLAVILHFVETYFDGEAKVVHDRPELAEEAVAFCMKGMMSTTKA